MCWAIVDMILSYKYLTNFNKYLVISYKYLVISYKHHLISDDYDGHMVIYQVVEFLPMVYGLIIVIDVS